MGCLDCNWVVAPGCTEISEFHLAQSVLTADSAEMLRPALMSQCELEEPMWVMYLQPKHWWSPRPWWSWVPWLGFGGQSLQLFDVTRSRPKPEMFRPVFRKGFFTRKGVSGIIHTWRFSRLGKTKSGTGDGPTPSRRRDLRPLELPASVMLIICTLARPFSVGGAWCWGSPPYC